MRALVGLSLLTAGCSMFMHSIEKPSARVRDVSVSAAGLTGLSGSLQLDVSNPNSFGVPLSGIDWQLSLGGSRALTGTVSLSQTIPARGVAPVSTSLTIDARDAAAVLASGASTYRLDAKLHFSTPVGNVDVAVSQSGTVGGAASALGKLVNR